ncbi:uncharacterized protein LOC131155983 [Malania oleifera]|uniref:uncharacterized protein LOC131155983 n=1 Tax=Malania oleifera TaxID=397392 RepID=UPI0025ADEAD9|nr:uncharacterized protein LOC131155983 [Malania oleifera]
MAFNPLAIILKENKLVGPNYIDLKRNFDIILTVKEYKYVLAEVCPHKPSEEATDEETQTYQKWIKADEMVWYYILASMSNVLQHQHQSMPSAYDIMQSLTKMLGYQNHILGVEIDGETQVDIVLQSLPDSFK